MLYPSLNKKREFSLGRRFAQTLAIVFWVITLVAFSPATLSFAESGTLYVVTQKAHGFQNPVGSDSEKALSEATEISAGTIVREVSVPEESVDTWRGEKFRLTQKMIGEEKTLWIKGRFLMALDEFAEKLVQESMLGLPESGGSFPRPWLIRFQDNPAVSAAWQSVSELIAKNAELPADQRLPDPFFARAEIWISVENYGDAVSDLISGIKICRERGFSPDRYLPFAEKLVEAIKNLETSPAPSIGAQLGWEVAASRQYSLGVTSYFTNDMNAALVSFTNCVAIAPEKPHYWYFRALTQRSLGRLDQAQHDALLGVHFEQKIDLSSQEKSMNERLRRIQGESRTWLERYRNGLVANHLVGPNRTPLTPGTATDAASLR